MPDRFIKCFLNKLVEFLIFESILIFITRILQFTKIVKIYKQTNKRSAINGKMMPLIDIIKEEQAKLGFFREDIRLYYPLSSLNHFFSATDNADEMQARLNALPTSITEKLGQIEISHKGDRFCFHIPKEGTVYVHDNTAPNEFIKSLVELVAKHDCTMNEILDLFHTYSQNIITEEINNDEFDRLIRFADKPEDTYYYCFKDEGCHIIYHRFLPEDYADFDF